LRRDDAVKASINRHVQLFHILSARAVSPTDDSPGRRALGKMVSKIFQALKGRQKARTFSDFFVPGKSASTSAAACLAFSLAFAITTGAAKRAGSAVHFR
jgi:hypothetical protein